MSKIILIEPPPTNKFGNMRQFGSIGTYKADIAYPPIDLMKIAGCLRKNKIDSMIIDANTCKMSINDILNITAEQKPKLMVFTTSTTAIINDMRLVEAVKKSSPDTITATFGAHIKGAAELTLQQFPFLDIAIYGDQEWVINEIAKNDFKYNCVKGLVYRQGNDIVKNEMHPVVQNLDEFGIAAHDMIIPHLYHDPFAKRLPLTVTYGQIGCINKCTYCMSTLYGNLRMRTVGHFFEELQFIVSLGFKEVFFIDCGFTNNRQWAESLLDLMINHRLDLTWWCLSRADKLDIDLIKKLKAAGCHSIGVGVESANDTVIKNIHKKVDLQRVRDIVNIAHKNFLKILLYFQFGLPGETRQSMQETLDFAIKSKADLVTFGIATPVPGTHFYEQIKGSGLFNTYDWSKYDPTLPPVYDYPHLSSDEIYAFSQYAYRKFYLRPTFIFKRFLQQRSLKDFKNNVSNFLSLSSRVFKK